MFVLKLSTLAAAVAALAVLGAGNAAPTDPWIVFTGAPGQGTQPEQLFRVRLSGSALKQITTGHNVATDPTFAADGRHVAFTRLSSGVFRISVDGSGVRRLTANGSDRFPAYAPNGRSIAFVRAAKNGGCRLWLMSANGRLQHRLRFAPALSAANRPSWTPDGKSLVIANGGSFYQVSATTGKVERRLAPSYSTADSQLLWTLSPTGRMLAYVGPRTAPPGCQGAECEVFALYLHGIASSQPQRVVADAGVPGWSADGRRLAYAYRGALAVQTATGGAVTMIPVGGTALDGDAPPAWQPR